jgi:hypothetical protein
VIPPSSVDESGASRGAAAGKAADRSPNPGRPAAHEPPAATAVPEAAPVVPVVSAPPPPPPATPATPSPEGAPGANPGADLTARPLASENAATTPIYRKWWFWAGAGALAVGLGLLAAVALSGSPSPPASGLGSQRVF